MQYLQVIVELQLIALGFSVVTWNLSYKNEIR